MSQTDLSGNPKLTKAEEEYLIFAEKQKVNEQRLDIQACKQMGLNEQEIKYLDLVYTAYKSFGTPAGSINDDALRYLIWDLDCLPRCDTSVSKITLQSFLDSVGIYNSKDVKKEDYFNSLKYTLIHAEERENQDLFLLKIYKKIYKWCQSFESIHKLKEKQTIEVSSAPEVQEVSVPEKVAEHNKKCEQAKKGGLHPFFAKSIQQQDKIYNYLKEQDKESAKEPAFDKLDEASELNKAEETVNNFITEKQKSYIERLAFNIAYSENLKDLDKFTKRQASSIIQILLRAPDDFEELFKEVVINPEKVLIPVISN